MDVRVYLPFRLQTVSCSRPCRITLSSRAAIPTGIRAPRSFAADRDARARGADVDGAREWDFFMIVFSVLDRAQHDYWADMDPGIRDTTPERPRVSRVHTRNLQAARRRHRAVDREGARGARIFVVSDHGFCSELYEVRVNELLASERAARLQVARPADRPGEAEIYKRESGPPPRALRARRERAR